MMQVHNLKPNNGCSGCLDILLFAKIYIYIYCIINTFLNYLFIIHALFHVYCITKSNAMIFKFKKHANNLLPNYLHNSEWLQEAKVTILIQQTYRLNWPTKMVLLPSTMKQTLDLDINASIFFDSRIGWWARRRLQHVGTSKLASTVN